MEVFILTFADRISSYSVYHIHHLTACFCNYFHATSSTLYAWVPSHNRIALKRDFPHSMAQNKPSSGWAGAVIAYFCAQASNSPVARKRAIRARRSWNLASSRELNFSERSVWASAWSWMFAVPEFMRMSTELTFD